MKTLEDTAATEKLKYCQNPKNWDILINYILVIFFKWEKHGFTAKSANVCKNAHRMANSADPYQPAHA